MGKTFLSKIRTYFITGLAVILPTFLTIIILKWLLLKINSWFLEPFVRWIRPYSYSTFLIFIIKLSLFFAILVLIVLCGAATRVLFVRKFFNWGERLLAKAPLISKIYIATKEISLALFGQKKGLFKKVVLVEFPRPGLFAIGFVTAEHIERTIIKRSLDDDLASIFVPTTPNPTSGTFVFVKKKDMIDVDISVEEALKLILSGGAIPPYSIKKKP